MSLTAATLTTEANATIHQPAAPFTFTTCIVVVSENEASTMQPGTGTGEALGARGRGRNRRLAQRQLSIVNPSGTIPDTLHMHTELIDQRQVQIRQRRVL